MQRVEPRLLVVGLYGDGDNTIKLGTMTRPLIEGDRPRINIPDLQIHETVSCSLSEN